MSKIVLVASGELPPAFLLKASRTTGRSIESIRSRALRSEPIWEAPLFGNDHGDKANRLRSLAEDAEALGVALDVFELEPAEDFEGCPRAECRIDLGIMRNILDEWDVESKHG